jgi:hypothetical protein
MENKPTAKILQPMRKRRHRCYRCSNWATVRFWTNMGPLHTCNDHFIDPPMEPPESAEGGEEHHGN